jgi:hypothetical protein
MQRQISKTIIFLFLILTLSSCFAYHTGYMNNSASLSSNNFSYVQKNIGGQSFATYIIGIGGLDQESLVHAAKLKLTEKHELKSNQAYVNTTVSFKTAVYFFVVTKVTCTITADIVEFNK